MPADIWIEEKYQDFLGLRLRVTKTLFSGTSDFQTVDIVETAGHGRVLLNDGLIMTTERDEFAYHEMIAHVPLFTHPNPKHVLIIGGGDGGTAREVLRHPSVESCTLVEIDEMVVTASKEHLPLTACSYDNPKMTCLIEDGVKFVKETTQQYDVILIDSTDPIGAAAPLFGAEFYRDVNNCLADGGIVVSQGETSWYDLETQQALLGVLNSVFPNVFLYSFSNLTYPSGLWSFTVASKQLNPIADFDAHRVADSGLSFKYYNESIHTAAFSLPNFAKEGLAGLIKN